MRMDKISVRCCVDLGFNVPHRLAWATPLGSTVLVHILSGGARWGEYPRHPKGDRVAVILRDFPIHDCISDPFPLKKT